MNAILALDQGTTSSRAIVFDEAGRALNTAQREFTQHFPQPARVEHDPMEIWETQRDTAAMALDGFNATGGRIAALGITNQRETTLLWERASGRPVGPAIVWQDRRTAAHCEALKAAGHEDFVRDRTGLVIDAYFSGTKLAWMLDHIDGARQRAGRGELAFGTVDSWLLHRLTGGKVHATDVSNASRTLLMNLHTLEWDDSLLKLMDVPREVLPRIVSSSGVVGETDCEGLPRGIPIAGLAGDQQAALFGQACHAPGMTKNTYGTGCFMLMNTGTRAVASKNRLLTTVAWRLGQDAQPTYALEGSVFIAGAAVQWLRDGLGIVANAADLESLAREVPDAGGVSFVPAFAGLGAPHWDPRARGLLIGLTRGTTRAHIARASLDAIALQSVELARAMAADAGIALAGFRVDGGASVNDLLMQLQSDIAQVAVTRPTIPETTALGAAYLAGLGCGIWKSTADIAQLWKENRTFTPQIGHEEAEARFSTWLRAVERSREWA